MNRLTLTSLALGAILFISTPVRAAQTVVWSLRSSVDSDGDGVNDLVDNAPGTSNVSQMDTDNDGIGDAIDPTPVNSNPSLGDPGLGMFGPPPYPPGSTVLFDYYMVLGTPPGGFGHIDIDFGGNGVYDATYFGPLTSSIDQIAVAANLFVDATWNLNLPGTYELHAKAYGPGMSSQNETFDNVTITPEPTALALLTIAASSLTTVARRRARVA